MKKNKNEQYVDLEKASELTSKEMEKEVNISENKIVHLEKKINELEDRLEKFQDKIDKKIEDSKIRVIETLGIFVALFTFISVEFQAFRLFHDFKTIAGISLILLGALIFFIIVLDIIINAEFRLGTTGKWVPGSIEQSMKFYRNMAGYYKAEEFKICSLKTWSESFKLRVILLVICIVMIITGIYLLSKTQYIISNYNNNVNQETNINDSRK